MLPSGRSLRYPNVNLNAEGQVVYNDDKKLWGGKIAENVVQAVARDFICDVMLRAEEAGYPVLLHIHDEIVVQVPKVQMTEAEQFLLESLRIPPGWLPDLPLDAESWNAKRYGRGE